jgi:acyl carrier protein
MDISATIIATIAEVLGKETKDITKDLKLNDEKIIDELDLIEIIMSLEETFKISIPDEESENFVTVEDIVNYIITITKPESGGK